MASRFRDRFPLDALDDLQILAPGLALADDDAETPEHTLRRPRRRLDRLTARIPDMRTYAIYQHGFYATQALAHAALKELAHIPNAQFVELEIPTDKNSVLALLNSDKLVFEVIDRFRLTPRGGFVRIDPSEPQTFVAGNGPKPASEVHDDTADGDDVPDDSDPDELDLGTPDPDAFKPRIGGPRPIDIWSQVFGVDFVKNPIPDPHRPLHTVGEEPVEAIAPTTAVAVTTADSEPEAMEWPAP